MSSARPLTKDRWRARPYFGLFVVVFISLTCLGLLLGLIATDAIRLGPSSVALRPDALEVSAVWYREADGDASFDYYGVLVTVINHEETESYVPFVVDVTVTVEEGLVLTGWYPHHGDHSTSESVSLSLPETNPSAAVTLRLPVGAVEIDTGDNYHRWAVHGEPGLGRQAVFLSATDFYLRTVRVPEDVPLRVHLDVLVEWYYVNPLQAYPVGSKAGRVSCYYAPTPGSPDASESGKCATIQVLRA